MAAVLLLVAGCQDLRPERPDPFQSVRDRLDSAAARQGLVPLGTAQQIAERAVTDPRAVRGFIRRGTPQIPRQAVVDDAPGADPEVVSLDFQGADLASVVEVMLGEGMGESYVLDPRVTGTVTLKSNRPLRQSEIVPTLEEILRLNDAALIARDGVSVILPRAEAGLAAPLVTARDLTVRGLTVRVTPLRYVSVADVADVLQEFAPATGSIRFDRARNLVFSVGTASEQATILNVLASIDLNQFAGRSFALRPLRDAEAVPVTDELTALFSNLDGTPSRAIRFVPIRRMNAVLIIADQQGLLNDAMSITRELDQGLGEAPRIHVFEIRNRRAEDIAVILGGLFEVSPTIARASDAGTLAPGLTPQTDVTGDATEANVPALTEPTAPSSRGVTLSPAESGRGGVFRIVADDSSNAIIALATGAGARALENALRRLDTQPLQVMIEATLLEVALNDTLEYGVRWFLESGNFAFSFGDALGTGLNAVLPGSNASFLTDDIQVTISALDAVTDVQVLSSPTLMVLDNQTARLQVGDQVPVTVRTATSVDDVDAPIVSETEFRDTGVILEIRPTVNAGGLVVLQIRQEVSDVTETVGDVNPTFAQKVIESTIAVESGATVALAGLIEENRSFGRQGLPGLSRIPILGSVFGTTEDAVGRSELLVLIRPVVVRNQNEAQAATEEMRRKLRSLAPLDPPRAPAISVE